MCGSIVLISRYFQTYVVAVYLSVVDVLQMLLPEENVGQFIGYPRQQGLRSGVQVDQ